VNLTEVLLAALLFSLSAGSSLRIWSLITVGVMQEERRQLLADRLDGELASLEASLRLHSRQSLQPPPCGNAATSLQTLLSSRPSGEGVQRRVTVLHADDGLLLELAIEGLPVRRQRLVLPAALGLCQSTPPTPGVLGPQIHG
jgi:hypothetical protein